MKKKRKQRRTNEKHVEAISKPLSYNYTQLQKKLKNEEENQCTEKAELNSRENNPLANIVIITTLHPASLTNLHCATSSSVSELISITEFSAGGLVGSDNGTVNLVEYIFCNRTALEQMRSNLRKRQTWGRACSLQLRVRPVKSMLALHYTPPPPPSRDPSFPHP